MTKITLRSCGFWLPVLSLSLAGCSDDNAGNVVTPPPHTSISQAQNIGGGSSVLPSLAGASAMGDASDVGSVWPSSGCNQPLPPEQVSTIPGGRTGYTEWNVTQTGATLVADNPDWKGQRQFFVRVPYDYDPARPYRVVYIGQGCGTYHGGKTNSEPLFDERRGGTEQAVYVGLSVPDNGANPGCYDNNNGAGSQEWEAFDLIHTFVQKSYCVDNNRIFVAGYSSGGWLANMHACYFGGTGPALDQPDIDAGRATRKFLPKWSVRGGARMTGSLPPNQPVPCNGPSAGIWIHDVLDNSNKIATNIAALNLTLATNGCTGDYQNGPKRPWAPAENIEGLKGGVCQEYTGCSAQMAKDYPLVFCTTSGFGHADQPSVVPAFTAFFEMMNPAP